MAWTTITYSFGSVLTSTKMTQNQDNFTAVAQGLTGAPKIQTAALEQTGGSQAVTVATMRPGTNNYVLRTSGAGAVEWSPVTISEIGAGTVAQAWLSTTTGEVSTTSPTPAQLILAGGSYGFYPQLKDPSGGGIVAALSQGVVATSYVTSIVMTAAGSTTVYAQQRYVQASPPYDLGDGEVPLFIFVLVENTGDIVAVYAAPEAPWHYNGPTDISAERYSTGRRGYRKVKQFFAEHGSIRAALQAGMTRGQITQAIASSPMVEIELTQAIKNADMGLLPHPFIGNNLMGRSVVLLDPVSPFVERLAMLHEAGESIAGLLHDGNLLVGNTELIRHAPSGVLACPCRWKLT